MRGPFAFLGAGWYPELARCTKIQGNVDGFLINAYNLIKLEFLSCLKNRHLWFLLMIV